MNTPIVRLIVIFKTPHADRKDYLLRRKRIAHALLDALPDISHVTVGEPSPDLVDTHTFRRPPTPKEPQEGAPGSKGSTDG